MKNLDSGSIRINKVLVAEQVGSRIQWHDGAFPPSFQRKPQSIGEAGTCAPEAPPRARQRSTSPSNQEFPMPLLKVRLTGSEADAATVISVVHGVDGVERVEEVADLMPHMDDYDSSSAGLVDDQGSGGVHAIEIEVPGPHAGDEVRELIIRSAESLGMAVEFVDEF